LTKIYNFGIIRKIKEGKMLALAAAIVGYLLFGLPGAVILLLAAICYEEQAKEP
jgi:hypothetical protein